ncbi:ATP-binding protein [Candidatus Pacearchaeota archaeon]|nr:ATP-binding protein [Candidatus Pacearchaeota archaeon]
MKNLIIIMAGLPGTGKSTLASKLVDSLENYDLYSLLNIRRDLGHKKYNSYQNEKVFTEMYRRMQSSLVQDKNVIVDSTHTTVNSRRDSYEIALKNNANALIIECFCLEEEAKLRIKKRPKNEGIIMEPRNPRVYDKLKDRMIKIDLDELPGGVSYVKYNSETSEFEKVKIEPELMFFIDKLESIVKLK